MPGGRREGIWIQRKRVQVNTIVYVSEATVWGVRRVRGKLGLCALLLFSLVLHRGGTDETCDDEQVDEQRRQREKDDSSSPSFLYTDAA